MLSVHVLKLLTASLECWLQLTSNLKNGRNVEYDVLKSTCNVSMSDFKYKTKNTLLCKFTLNDTKKYNKTRFGLPQRHVNK